MTRRPYRSGGRTDSARDDWGGFRGCARHVSVQVAELHGRTLHGADLAALDRCWFSDRQLQEVAATIETGDALYGSGATLKRRRSR